jgi:TetR/AcrR family tetracycline transcriptional repressor
VPAATPKNSENTPYENRSPEVEGDSHTEAPSIGQRPSLSRETILRASLHIADRDGLGGLTMRKIAGHLGSSPMGVYRHFRNKAEIVGGLVDLVIGDYDVTGHREPSWREWIRETFLRMRGALCAHPGIIPLLGAAAFSGNNALAILERVLEVLHRAGLGEAAAPLFHTLMSYTIGSVAIESSALPRTADEDDLDVEEQRRRAQLSFEVLPRSTYPNVVASAPQLAGFATNRHFLTGLDRILVRPANTSQRHRGRLRSSATRPEAR